jgi:transposase
LRSKDHGPGAERIARHLDDQIRFLTAQTHRPDRPPKLTAQIKQRHADLAAIIKANAIIQRDEAALRATPGIGPVSARALIAFLPGLGALSKRPVEAPCRSALSKRQLASLAGHAPHPRDSGQTSARRTIGAARSGIKEPLLHAALRAVQDCPTLKAFYKRLVKAGQPKRLARTAVARKRLVCANAIIKDLRAKNDEELSLT